MPELPEVAQTANSLNRKIKNSNLNEIIIHSGRYSRHGNPLGFDNFIKDLPAKIEGVKFFGKLIVFYVTTNSGRKNWIWNTLGMSGGWSTSKMKHSHIEFKTSNGSVFFTDPRNFGTMKFIFDEKENQKKISSIGPNHLNDEIPDSLFKERLMKYPEATMPEALMNQALIGGIGNYIKSEILYRAGISPHRLIKSLSDEEFSKLNKATSEVIISSYQSRGATIKTYKNMDGESGNFVFYFKVYGRSICDKGFPVIKEITKEGRTTWWTPEIQK